MKDVSDAYKTIMQMMPVVTFYIAQGWEALTNARVKSLVSKPWNLSTMQFASPAM